MYCRRTFLEPVFSALLLPKYLVNDPLASADNSKRCSGFDDESKVPFPQIRNRNSIDQWESQDPKWRYCTV